MSTGTVLCLLRRAQYHAALQWQAARSGPSLHSHVDICNHKDERNVGSSPPILSLNVPVAAVIPQPGGSRGQAARIYNGF